MLRDLPAARFEKLSLVIWRFGWGRCLMSQQGALRPAEPAKGLWAPAEAAEGTIRCLLSSERAVGHLLIGCS